jgi:prepilin-type N-terminal cleavage/methylation domain-containing protein
MFSFKDFARGHPCSSPPCTSKTYGLVRHLPDTDEAGRAICLRARARRNRHSIPAYFRSLLQGTRTDLGVAPSQCIRPARSSPPAPLRGFTLLEVCFALFIVAVLFVVAVPPAAHLYEEEQLRKPVRELQGLAKTARRQAMITHQPYQVLLSGDRLVMAPAEKKEDSVEKTYVLPTDVAITVKHINEKDYKRPADDKWFFAANGLCEPMSFLFRRGDDWIRFQVSPLTARIENQQSFIR